MGWGILIPTIWTLCQQDGGRRKVFMGAMGVAVVLFLAAWVVYIIYSMVSMEDRGPSAAVVSKWKQENGKGS